MWSTNSLWICTVLGTLRLTKSAYLRCYRSSLDDYDVAPLAKAESLLESSCYNSSRGSVMYAFGFSGKVNGTATTAVLSALIKINHYNIFLCDWQKEASSIELLGNIGRQLSYAFHAIPNTFIVGWNLAKALSKMSTRGFNLNRIHLVAHSLGAHLFGNTGRYLLSIGLNLFRITGLDPARPLYDQPRLVIPLGSDSADFVDIVHTDPGGYGINSSNAHVDFYVNFRFFINPDDSHVQPGCPVGKFEMFSREDLCSHDRAWMLFIESLLRKHSLQASKASNYYELEASGGISTDVIYMGDDIDRNARGNYYLSTNSQPPYGRGPAGLQP